MGEITYQGEPPFRLPTARPTSARVSGRSVEMTVYVSVAGKGPTDVQIQIPMSIDEAKILMADLRESVLAAEKEQRGR